MTARIPLPQGVLSVGGELSAAISDSLSILSAARRRSGHNSGGG
jgi:hypothetical protein